VITRFSPDPAPANTSKRPSIFLTASSSAFVRFLKRWDMEGRDSLMEKPGARRLKIGTKCYPDITSTATDINRSIQHKKGTPEWRPFYYCSVKRLFRSVFAVIFQNRSDGSNSSPNQRENPKYYCPNTEV